MENIGKKVVIHSSEYTILNGMVGVIEGIYGGEAFIVHLNGEIVDGFGKSVVVLKDNVVFLKEQDVPESKKPANCRERLIAEGKPYPRSGCYACDAYKITTQSPKKCNYSS